MVANKDYVRVENLREIQRELRMIDKDLPKELRKINKAAAEIVADDARKYAPVGPTGRLKKSIGVKAEQRGASIKAGSAARVPYAGPIIYGWRARNIAPQRFMQRAVVKTRPVFTEEYETELRALLKRVDSSKFRL